MRRRITFLAAVVFLLALISAYRTYIDHSPFLLSFDRLARAIVSEIWKILSTPTVFLAAILALVLIAYREQLAPLALGLREVTFGAFTAKFLARQALALEEESVEQTIRTQEENAPRLADSTKREIVGNLSQETCLYFLQVANKSLPLEEHFRLISLGIFKRGAEVPDVPQLTALLRGVEKFEASGFLRALYQFQGLVARFKFETINGSLNLVARVDSDVLDLIRKRVGKEPDVGEKQSPS